jgi:hypothetical protein
MRSLATLLVVLGCFGRVAHADSQAEKLYLQGQQAYDAARYDDALTAWTQSYALSKLPALLFNLAQAQRLRARPGDCTQATANYKEFIAQQPKSSERPTAEGFIAELSPCVEREAAPISPPIAAPVRPVLDAATRPSTAPPPADSHASRSSGSGKRFAGYAVGGAGLVLVVTGVYFGSKARRLGDEVSDDCRDGCDWNLVKDKDAEGKSAETTQYLLYGVGVGLIAAGGVLWYLGNTERRQSQVAVTPTTGGAAITWRGSW